VKITRIQPFLKIALLALLLSIITNGMAQDNLLLSTIETAKQLRNDGNFEQAAIVLDEFDTRYPGNIWVLRMLAETLFRTKDYEKSALVYEEALRRHPDDFDVKYEYAILLFEMGKYQYTRDLLIVYTDNNPENPGAESLLGITNYYLGNFKEADEHLQKSLALNPTDNRTKDIYRQVSHIVKPWLKTDVTFTDDSQPMKQWIPALQGGWYQSHFLNLSLLLGMQNFSSDTIHSNFYNFQLQNKFQFPKTGFSAVIAIGGFYTSVNQTFDYSWGIFLHQKIAKYLHLKVGGERSAYTYTLSSIAKPFSRGRYTGSLSWEKPKKWNASAGYIGEHFPDDNHVQTYYAWGLSPAISFSVFELYFGYAYNYANAKESRYVPEKTLDEILDNYNPDEQIKGIYDPYFTPNKQFAHSALLNLALIPSQKVNIKLHASVGFYARAMNPYFYLDKKNNGNTYIRQDFYQESFTPLDLGLDLNTDISDEIILNFSYTYLQTFYFNSNNFNLGLKIYF
jgi:tetratricopeptide (TPR) repeat protein